MYDAVELQKHTDTHTKKQKLKKHEARGSAYGVFQTEMTTKYELFLSHAQLQQRHKN